MSMITEPRDSHGIAASSSLSSASLRFLLLGDVGVGKSTFVDTFISTLANVQSTEQSYETVAVPPDSSSLASSASFQLEVTQVKTGSIPDRNSTSSASSPPVDDPLGLIPPKITTPAREISFITVPGYSSTLNPSQTLSTTDDYLNHHLRTVTSVFSPTIPSAQLAWFLIKGSKAHTLPTCAFYFVLYELKPIDLLYMKLIHERVNLVPVIAKADTVSKNELWVLKRRMIRQLKLNGIQFHTFGLDLDTVEAMTEQRQWGAPPFVVSTKVDPHSQELFESELEGFVQLCVYDRVRFMQADAAHKVISWRRAFGPSTNTAATAEQIWHQNALNRSNTNTNGGHGATVAPPALEARPTEFAPFTPPPPSSLPSSTAISSDAHSTMTSQFLPQPSFTAGGVVVQPYTSVAPTSLTSSPSPIAANSALQSPMSTPGHSGAVSLPPSMSQGSMSPRPSSATAYTPSTTYSPTPRNATEARVMVIHHSTGMAVDSSNRPSEIIDSDTINTVHTHPTTEGDHFAGDSIFKVEIPNSGMSYYPGTDPSVVGPEGHQSNTEAIQQQQQQQGYLYQGGAYLVPPGDLYQADLYQAALMAGTGASAINASTSNLVNLGGMVVGMDGQHIPDIWEAAELGDLATVQYHLNNGISPDQRNSSKSTLLHRTAWQGTHPYAVMRLLISYGANVNLANENGNTVLQNVLMKHDDPQLIKLLLDNGAEAMILNKEGMNTLEVAALFNKLESARYLLENDLSSSEPQSIVNALQRAKSPDKKAVKTLLRSWQGRDGEKRRFELMQRLQLPEAAQQQQNKQPKQQHQASTGAVSNDGASIHSFETSKGGNPNSSKASSVHHDDFGGSTTNVSTVSSQHSNGHQTTNSTLTSTQQKHMSRFNLKAMRTAAPSMSNLFGRKN
ncbi:Septin-14 [Podila horticola]|nr:Septin-14 [Podila horticola]